MRPLIPPTLKIDLTSDMSNDVRLMLSDLETNILSELILVVAVILGLAVATLLTLVVVPALCSLLNSLQMKAGVRHG